MIREGSHHQDGIIPARLDPGDSIAPVDQHLQLSSFPQRGRSFLGGHRRFHLRAGLELPAICRQPISHFSGHRFSLCQPAGRGAHPGLQGDGGLPGVRGQPAHAALDIHQLPAKFLSPARPSLHQTPHAGCPGLFGLRPGHCFLPRHHFYLAGLSGLFSGARRFDPIESRQRVRHCGDPERGLTFSAPSTSSF